MIEVRKASKLLEFIPNAVFIDGVELSTEYGHFSYSQDTGKIISISIYPKLSPQVLAHRFSDLPSQIHELSITPSPPMIAPDVHADIVIARDNDERFSLGLMCKPDGRAWKHLWSIIEYIEEFELIVKRNKALEIQWGEEDEKLSSIPRFRLHLPVVEDVTLTIEAATSSHISTIKQIHESIEASLTAKLRSDSVVIQFDFPEEVRVPCEQYLLYFAQFLHDLGVQADAALTHEAGQVLFTVTPADKEQALDTIRAALNTYLHLPSNPISNAVNESIAVQRLESNILRLRSDLKLAAAELQAKNTTIEAQQLIIEVHKGLLSGEVVVNSIKDVTPRPKDMDKEELLGGTVSIIPLKGKGLEINLPELFRRLKRLFKEE